MSQLENLLLYKHLAFMRLNRTWWFWTAFCRERN